MPSNGRMIAVSFALLPPTRRAYNDPIDLGHLVATTMALIYRRPAGLEGWSAMRPTGVVHLGLMLVAFGVTYLVPFGLLLLAYVVPVPAHYLSEVAWSEWR